MIKTPNIGIFGHYGNKNLGDEAIIEAMIDNMRSLVPDANISCLSINPFDSNERHNVFSFPIRYKKEYFENDQISTKRTVSSDHTITHTESVNNNLKEKLKALPILGGVLKSISRVFRLTKTIKNELYFFSKASQFLKSLDLLVICGSNQLLDNFGGPWGFPYTLLKWTLLSKINGTKVAFVSVGAGPLEHRLSYFMLNIALKNADYISYRDNGSKELIKARIKNINGEVFPDIAHGLNYIAVDKNTTVDITKHKIIGINPMPVYDKRYWAKPDDKKYKDYVDKLALLCKEILTKGHSIKLFGTQSKDQDVINDVIEIISKDNKYVDWANNCSVLADVTVSDLMDTISSCDIVIATRFHATVLPLQLNIPVLGICYYKKSSELLNEVGLEQYHVNIEDFKVEDLIKKFEHLIIHLDVATDNIASTHHIYKNELDRQFKTLVGLLN